LRWALLHLKRNGENANAQHSSRHAGERGVARASRERQGRNNPLTLDLQP
jgi:hypothetical protein